SDLAGPGRDRDHIADLRRRRPADRHDRRRQLRALVRPVRRLHRLRTEAGGQGPAGTYAGALIAPARRMGDPVTAEDTNTPTEPALAPVAPKQRIASLDLIRGLAVLGILAVNVGGFAATLSAYGNASLWPFPNEGWAAI